MASPSDASARLAGPHRSFDAPTSIAVLLVAVVSALVSPIASAQTQPSATQNGGEVDDGQAAIRITPYALLTTSFYWNSAPLANADAPFAALGGEGEAFGATTRQSRLGVRADVPAAASALHADAITAVSEVDFFGGYYAGSDVTYFMPHIRLRLLHASVRYGPLSVVVGQDWMVFAPLNPISTTHVAVAGFQGSGNAWARLPQLRVDLRIGRLHAQAAVLAPAGAGAVSEDVSPGLTVARTPGRADRSETPSVQARVAYGVTLDGRAMTLGLSAHYGRDQAPIDDPQPPIDDPQPAGAVLVDSFGLAFDLDAPLLEWLAIRAEAYLGQDLDGLFVDADVANGSAVPARGGWVQLTVRVPPFAAHFGVGIEDPDPPDGKTLPSGAMRLGGAMSFALVCTVDALSIGLELRHLWNRRVGTAGTQTGAQLALAVTLVL